MKPGDAALYLDECVPYDAAEALRALGWDAVNAHDRGRLGLHDDPQLQLAAEEQRILLTFDPDYLEIHTEWLVDGRSHAGILISPEYKDLRRYLNDVRHTLGRLPASAFTNNLLWVAKA